MPTCDPLSLSIADALDRRRRLLGLSQKALAARLGVSESFASRRLDGHSMRTTTVHKIATALGCEIRIDLTPRTLPASAVDNSDNPR